MDEQVKNIVDDLRELSAETGVDGVPRLLALFRRRHRAPEGFTPAMMSKIAREVLATIYHSVGINPHTIVYNHLNQPRDLVKADALTGILS